MLAETDNVDQLLLALVRIAGGILGSDSVEVTLDSPDFNIARSFTFPLVTRVEDEPVGWLVADVVPTDADQFKRFSILALIASASIRRARALQKGKKRIFRLRAAKKTLTKDIFFARDIMREMLPQSVIDTPHLSVAGRLEPTGKLGGDCYNYELQGGKVHFLLADAVGHGLGSTLLVLECRAAWRALTMAESSLAEKIRLLNLLLFENIGPDRFVAGCFGTIEEETGLVELALCGVSPLFLFRSEKEAIEQIVDPDPPLGLFCDTGYQMRRFALKPGDCLTIVSDGVIDWQGPEGVFFGEQRLAEMLLHCATFSPTLQLNWIFTQLAAFGGKDGQTDDACSLVIQRRAL